MRAIRSHAIGINITAYVDGVIASNTIKGLGSGTGTCGILADGTTDVACKGNRIKGFNTGIKTTGTCDYWAVTGNSLRGFVSGGATASLVGSINSTTGANV
jgi:hypothetical protein